MRASLRQKDEVTHYPDSGTQLADKTFEKTENSSINGWAFSMSAIL